MADRIVRAVNPQNTAYTGKFCRMAERAKSEEVFEQYKGETIVFEGYLF